MSQPFRSHGAADVHLASGSTRMYPTPGIPDSDDEAQAEQHENDTYLANGDYAPDNVLLPGIPPNPAFQASTVESSPTETRRRLHSQSYSRPFVMRAYTDDEDVFTKRIHGAGTARARQRTRTMDTTSSNRVAQVARPSTGGASSTATRMDRETAINNEPPTHAVSGVTSQLSSTPPSRSNIGTKPSRNRLQKQPPTRSRSPPSSRAKNKSVPSNVPDPSNGKRAADVLRLMKLTRGAISGNLYYRTSPSSPWALSFCTINTQIGSFVRESANATSQKPLIQDLRGCKVRQSFDAYSSVTLLNITTDDINTSVQIRPQNKAVLDEWFAALLCWRPVKRDQQLSHSLQRYPKPVPTGHWGSSRHENASGKEPAIIKVGKMMFVDPVDADNIFAAHTPTPFNGPHSDVSSPRASWQKVSCILRENGELKIYTTSNVTTVATVRLSSMSRSAVQRLSPTVFEAESCLAIYPQYARYPDACSRLRPIFLSPDSRVLFEVWFVLLRAFTIPDLHGPPNSLSVDSDALLEGQPGLPNESMSMMFRVERSLHLKVSEAKFKRPSEVKSDAENLTATDWALNGSDTNSNYYGQVSLNGQVKARTTLKHGLEDLQWFEQFQFPDIANDVSSVRVQIKRSSIQTVTNPRLKPAGTSKESLAPSWTSDNLYTQSIDPVCGEVSVELTKLQPAKESEDWCPLLDQQGRTVGSLLLKLRIEQDVILMDQEYQQLSQLLHNFSNALTIHIAECIPTELSKLSEYLLNIFQVSGQVSDWLMALAEEEIDGVLKEQPVSRTRFVRRLNSSEFKESIPVLVHPNDREWLLRDMSKTATAEANLLFRGNTLLSKALDLHMKRLGREYVEETLGPKLREICMEDPNCEVDPTKLSGNSWHELQQHWDRLLLITQEIWTLIYKSAPKCPTELRIIFRHVRACANDRYGDFSRSVPYTSVAAFVFLRFFCAAVLNPRLFNLARDSPKPHAQRTFTLVAKTLQGLANMSTFGHKEPWMEQMNTFLSANRQQFKDFIDSICNVASDQPIVISPSYSTPLAIFTRLPVPFREGFPSLPHLIDHSRNFSALVNLWLDNCHHVGISVPNGDRSGTSGTSTTKTLTGGLLHFHNLCVSLRQRTGDALSRAERSDRWTSDVSQKWTGIAQHLENNPDEFFVDETSSVASANGGPTVPVDAYGRKQSVPETLPLPRGQDFHGSGTESEVHLLSDGRDHASDSAAAVTTDDDQAIHSNNSRSMSPHPGVSSTASSDVENNGETPNRRKDRKKRKQKAKEKTQHNEGERDRSRSGYGLFGRKRKS